MQESLTHGPLSSLLHPDDRPRQGRGPGEASAPGRGPEAGPQPPFAAAVAVPVLLRLRTADGSYHAFNVRSSILRRQARLLSAAEAAAAGLQAPESLNEEFPTITLLCVGSPATAAAESGAGSAVTHTAAAEPASAAAGAASASLAVLSVPAGQSVPRGTASEAGSPTGASTPGARLTDPDRERGERYTGRQRGAASSAHSVGAASEATALTATGSASLSLSAMGSTARRDAQLMHHGESHNGPGGAIMMIASFF